MENFGNNGQTMVAAEMLSRRRNGTATRSFSDYGGPPVVLASVRLLYGKVLKFSGRIEQYASGPRIRLGNVNRRTYK